MTAIESLWFCGAVCLLFASCASTPKPRSDSQNAALTVSDASVSTLETSEDEEMLSECNYVDDLNGVWECTDGTGFIYPFNADSKSYLLYHGSWKDVTNELSSLAKSQGLTIDELWQKRHSLYSWKNPKTGKEMQMPASDENGVEKGIKFYRQSGHIYIRDEYLITEFVLGRNLRYFLMSQDGMYFKTGKVLHLFSRVFPDMNNSGKKYVKKSVEDQNRVQ